MKCEQERTNCVNYNNGGCRALCDTHFETICPFYKKRKTMTKSQYNARQIASVCERVHHLRAWLDYHNFYPKAFNSVQKLNKLWVKFMKESNEPNTKFDRQLVKPFMKWCELNHIEMSV